MRPYRLRIRLSSRRLNVTRFGGGTAVAVRATAGFSLGSVSSDVELMERLLKPVPIFREHAEADMIALTAGRRKGVQIQRKPLRGPTSRETSIHGIVSGILLLPYFCQPPAPLGCDKRILRWPGPFGSGFLSPQPPGAVGIGPIRRGVHPDTGPTKVGPFSLVGQAGRSALDAAAFRRV